MALDEPTETDDTFEEKGFTFVIEKQLNEQAKPFTVDISYMGFVVNSSMPLGGGGGSCSSSGCSSQGSGCSSPGSCCN